MEQKLLKKHKLLKTGNSNFHENSISKIKLGKIKGFVKMSDIKKTEKILQSQKILT